MRNLDDFRKSFFIEIMWGSNPHGSTFNTDLIHRHNKKYTLPPGSLAQLVKALTSS